MTTFATCSSENAARRAVAAWRGNGSEDDVRLLIGRALHDTLRERVGGFAGPVAPDGRVGSFANRPVERRRGYGSFAGDPDRQRHGCFADSDRVVVATRRDGIERTRATGELGVCRLLRRTGLSDEVVVSAIGELRAGHTVVVVDRTVGRVGQRSGRVRARVGGSVRAGLQRADAVTRAESLGDAFGVGMLADGFRAGSWGYAHRPRGGAAWLEGKTSGSVDEPGTGAGR